MALELINKKHEEITSNERSKLPVYFQIEDYKSIRFSAGAVLRFGLNQGLFIHFQNDDNKWFFYCNADTDGFELKALGKSGRKATLAYSVSLVNLILKRTLCSIGTKFIIKETKARVKNDCIFEIDFNKPIILNSEVALRKKMK